MLLPLYINYIYHAITSKTNVIAFGSFLYINIRIQNSVLILQDDLDTTAILAVEWLMELNINQFVVHSILNKWNHSFHDINLLDAKLKRMAIRDYLCVIISSDLIWMKHAKKFQTGLEESLDYLKQTNPTAHKTLHLMPT